MNDGRATYLELCEAADLAAAVSNLTPSELTAVAEYLAGGKRRGISALVWGEVQQALTERGSA